MNLKKRFFFFNIVMDYISLSGSMKTIYRYNYKLIWTQINRPISCPCPKCFLFYFIFLVAVKYIVQSGGHKSSVTPKKLRENLVWSVLFPWRLLGETVGNAQQYKNHMIIIVNPRDEGASREHVAHLWHLTLYKAMGIWFCFQGLYRCGPSGSSGHFPSCWLVFSGLFH